MGHIHSYPKVFAVGAGQIPNLFDGEVEITKKIKERFFESHDKMFSAAVAWREENQEGILSFLPGTYFYGEYLSGCCQNLLVYDRITRGD